MKRIIREIMRRDDVLYSYGEMGYDEYMFRRKLLEELLEELSVERIDE